MGTVSALHVVEYDEEMKMVDLIHPVHGITIFCFNNHCEVDEMFEDGWRIAPTMRIEEKNKDGKVSL